jgi:hypothetical protein
VFEFSLSGWIFFIGASQMAFGTWFVNKRNAFTDIIMCTLWIYGKKMASKIQLQVQPM